MIKRVITLSGDWIERLCKIKRTFMINRLLSIVWDITYYNSQHCSNTILFLKKIMFLIAGFDCSRPVSHFLHLIIFCTSNIIFERWSRITLLFWPCNKDSLTTTWRWHDEFQLWEKRVFLWSFLTTLPKTNYRLNIFVCLRKK